MAANPSVQQSDLDSYRASMKERGGDSLKGDKESTWNKSKSKIKRHMTDEEIRI